MARRTSLLAYNEIKNNGLLSKVRLLVYETLYQHGPMTAGELTLKLMHPNEVHPSYHRRLDELRERGVAERVGERPCNVTGHLADVWDVTDVVPVNPPKVTRGEHPPSDKQIAQALEDMKVMFQLAKQHGVHVSKEFVLVAAWLNKGAPCGHP